VTLSASDVSQSATAPQASPLRVTPATIVGLLLILGGRLGFHLVSPGFAPQNAEARAWFNVLFAWALTLLLLLLIRFWERQPWSSIGFRTLTRSDIYWALGAFLLGGAIISGTIPLVAALGLRSTEAGVRTLSQLPFELRLLLVFTAGITEEIRYRGYLIERVRLFTGSLLASSAISYLVFALVHLPFWGLGGALQIGLASLVLYVLYWKRRNLPACMLMHILNNAVAFLLIPAVLPAR
jgi:membrane protease YdiL (CAAX protease family)